MEGLEAIRVLEEWRKAYNAGDLDRLRGLHMEGAVLARQGLGAGSHKLEAGEAAVYDAALHTRWRLEAPEVEGGKVRAVVAERSDWLEAAGIQEAHYHAEFEVRDGRIVEAKLEANPETRRRAEEAFREFTVWAARERPERLAQLISGGRFDLGPKSGSKLLELMREWRAATQH